MRLRRLHPWDVTPDEAVALQHRFAGQLDLSRPLAGAELVAGADVSYNRFSDVICASVVVWRASDGAVVETQDAVAETHFPYVPGLLSFREAPALLAAYEKLQTVPDAVLFDGQGIAHPRRMGIASHLGLWVGRPSVGCGKSKLYGRFEEPGAEAGAMSPLTARGDVIGQVVRTKARVQPVFVSPGHLIDMASAVRLVLATTRGRRLPEPSRLAHEAANALRRREGS
jgi:deoxyribonuclease V